jgi:two-component system OmpR family response regulator
VAELESALPERPDGRPRGHVLVADDEPGTVALIADILEYSGFEVVTASDGLEALVRAREHRPQMAFLDVMMPGLDGREVCRRIRADPALAGTRVVLHSSADEQDIDWRGAGADGFVRKPFRVRDLPATLDRFLRG